MNKIIRIISDELKTNYKVGQYNALAAGWLSFLGHPAYWLIWTYIFPHHQESAFFRFSSSLLGLGLILNKYWPEKIKKYLPFYWYFFLVWILPTTFTYLGLKNNFTDVWIVCEIMAIFFIILFNYTWVLGVVNLILGSLLGTLFFYISNGAMMIVEERHIEASLPTIFVIFAGVLFAHLGRLGASGYIKQEKQKDLELALQEGKSKHLQDKANSLKSLAGSIAHELRNPLNTINLAQNQSQELLLESASEDINQNIKQQLTDINSSISSSVTEANNTINIILADLGNKPIEPSDFSYLSTDKILPEIIKTFGYRNLEEKEKVKLNVKDNFIFKAIDDRFTFIIYNLLKNSLYYLNEYPNSIVTIGTETFHPSLRATNGSAAIQNGDVEMTGLPRHASMARNDGSGNGSNGSGIDYSKYNVIYVHDTGPGIPSEILPKLFGDFFTSGKKDGTGLGLAFCKRNMKIFDGDIIVESETAKDGENGWTKFSLLFPKLSEEEIKAAETEAKRKKILIVDDQQVNLLTTKSRVEQNLANIICDLASNGKEAINLTKENKYHLILMDIQMPEMNGVTATKEIRKFNKDIPIIAYTSLDHDLEKIKAATNDILKKPVAENILFRTISKWITNYKDEFSYLGSKEEYKLILQNKNILLADDQKMNLMMTKKSLENYGLKVTTAKDGKELLEIYHSNPNSFNLIITDINMPPHNGDEAAKEIRKTNQNIPIIALSGDGEKKDIHHFFNSGMNDYFIKGGNPELLIKIVANYLIKKNLQLTDNKQKEDQPEIELDNLEDDSQLKILNLEKINFLDPESKKSVFDLFLKSSKEILDQIKQNNEINNLKELSFHVHSLKGISGNIGAERLFEYTKNLDLDIKQGKIPSDKNWFEQLELMYKELVGEIKALV